MDVEIPFNSLKYGFEKYRDEYIQAATRVLDSGWYVLGKEVEAFESEFAKWLGLDHCVGLNSGLDALILALKAMEIGQGDEVIVPANTYIASILAITDNHLKPVLVEPDISRIAGMNLAHHNIAPYSCTNYSRVEVLQ